MNAHIDAAPLALRSIPPAPPIRLIHPMHAYRTMRQVIAEPDNVPMVAKLIELLQGSGPWRVYRRMKWSQTGRAILAEQPDILARLNDHAWLESLPANTLGANYLRFMRDSKIDGDWFAAAVAKGRRMALGDDAPPPHFVEQWLRDTHDLYHVVTGWGSDVLGELAVLAFTFAQTRNFSALVISTSGCMALRKERSDVGQIYRRAMWQGMRARVLHTQDWMSLIDQPLEEVRRQLNIVPAPAYEHMYAD